ncbi:transcription factor atf21 [Paramyrothecium foliicola]|nr:transcription factor atf21 [Paramyrothecium foliicola]
MATSVEAWSCLGPVALSPPEPVEGQTGQTGQMWRNSGCGLKLDIPSFQTDVILHSHSFQISPNLEERSPLSHQSKLPTIAQDNDYQNVSRQTASPSQHTIWSSGSDDKAPSSRPKRHREMSHGQNKKKKASDFNTQNVFHLPRAAINARHGTRGRKHNIAQPRLIIPPPQQLDAVDEELNDDKFDLYNVGEEHLAQESQRQRALKRNSIAAKRSRGRKRDEAAALTTRAHDVETQNRYLSTCYNSLTTEVYLLKSELLRHTGCDCALIQKYINNEARKSVENMNSSPPSFQTDNQTTLTHLDQSTRASRYFDSDVSKLEDQMNLESPEIERNGGRKEFAIQMVDDGEAAYEATFNHYHNHIRDDTTKLSHECNYSHQSPTGFYDHASIYLSGHKDRAKDQALGYSFNLPIDFEPSLMKLNDGSVQI